MMTDEQIRQALQVGHQMRELLLGLPYEARRHAIGTMDVCMAYGTDLLGQGVCHCRNDE